MAKGLGLRNSSTLLLLRGAKKSICHCEARKADGRRPKANVAIFIGLAGYIE